MSILHAINAQLNGNQCPTPGCIGECAAITRVGLTDSGPLYEAALYLWDNEFNDSALVAHWFHEAGAEGVVVRHILHCDLNGDRDGRTEDRARAWTVSFTLKEGIEP